MEKKPIGIVKAPTGRSQWASIANAQLKWRLLLCSSIKLCEQHGRPATDLICHMHWAWLAMEAPVVLVQVTLPAGTRHFHLGHYLLDKGS
jgi:hypothetical protein